MADGDVIGEARGGVVPPGLMPKTAEGPFDDKPLGGGPEPHPGAGFEYATLARVRDAARALKAAEDAVAAARQNYGEAIKAMSEEAVR